MIKVKQISSDLVANSALLASGSCWLIAGGGIAAFGLMAAPLAGLGGLSVSAFYKRLKSKSPNSRKAVARIQDAIYRNLAKEAFFDQIDLDRDEFEAADKVLADHIVAHWPTPQVLVKLSTEQAGFPKSVAKHVLSSMNESIFATGLFEKETPRKFAMLTIEASLEAALTEESYFEEIEPHAIMKLLDHSGEISRGVRRLEGLADDVQVVGDTLNRVESKLDEQSAKLDEILSVLKSSTPTNMVVDEQLNRSIVGMLNSELTASQEAVNRLLDKKQGLSAAEKCLEEAIKRQHHARVVAEENEVELLRQLGTIRSLSSPSAAIEAFERLLILRPCDADALNMVGRLHLKFGQSKSARRGFLLALKSSRRGKSILGQAIAHFNLGELYTLMDWYKSAYTNVSKALKLATEVDNKSLVGACSLQLAMITLRADGTADADKNARLFVDLTFKAAQELEDHTLMARGFSMAALVEMQSGNFSNALKLSKNAIARYMYVAKDEHALVTEFITQGILFRKMGDFQDSKTILETAVSSWSEAHHAELLASAHAQLGETLSALKQPVRALEEYEKAEALYVQIGADQKTDFVRERIGCLKAEEDLLSAY